MKKIISIIASILALGLLGFVIFINTALKTNSEKKLQELEVTGLEVVSDLINTTDGALHFTRSGNVSGIPVVFIHGSPGSWDNWLAIQSNPSLNQRFCMYSVDRPGFGQTTIPHTPSLSGQSDAIIPLLSKINQKSIIVGHSYGGAVAEQLALDNPNLVRALIYVAGTLDPETQKPKWYNHLANTKIVQSLLADLWGNSSAEMTQLSKDLYKNEKEVASIRISSYIIQGKKDILVHPKTAVYYQNLNPKVEIIWDEDENHFIPWTKPELIIDILNQIATQQ